MIFYKLSSRQRAAVQSGTGLRLAIPLISWSPFDGSQDELREWFADSIPELAADDINDVEVMHVWVHLLNRGGGSGSLAAAVGEIIDRDNAPSLPAYSMRVAVATIGAGNRLTRWPGGEVIYAKHEAT